MDRTVLCCLEVDVSDNEFCGARLAHHVKAGTAQRTR